MINLIPLFKKPFEWWAERQAEKDTNIYLKLHKKYSPEQARRIWIELKRRRKKRWWGL